MSRRFFIVPLAVIAVVAVSVQSASAGCAEDIQKAEQVRRDSASGPRALNAFDVVLARAKKALAAGQERKCQNIVKAALSKL